MSLKPSPVGSGDAESSSVAAAVRTGGAVTVAPEAPPAFAAAKAKPRPLIGVVLRGVAMWRGGVVGSVDEYKCGLPWCRARTRGGRCRLGRGEMAASSSRGEAKTDTPSSVTAFSW
eukprot:CAMPEP_0206466994 /NCGR_PEP_ID=MMETSP0324_2-20121206/28787_1 /ASSEMBLY_ACC=CAM_ASM_000836 /TAXON_ID=2866 /ORGANISM="Crypthecodinium cohnii, Strain Seligo" /LENGTH=115 /DNA_ID=CAMNT_0053940211 /DNA_START=346 /DNA_END=693 /DNA_ORIENTATION=-